VQSQSVRIQRREHDGPVQPRHLLWSDTAAGAVRPRPSTAPVTHHTGRPCHHHSPGRDIQSIGPSTQLLHHLRTMYRRRSQACGLARLFAVTLN